MKLAPAAPMTARVPLTALVDVVFILLFFFMLASRSLDWRVLEIDLGETAIDAGLQAPPPNNAFLVLPNGELHNGDGQMALADAIGFYQRADSNAGIALLPAPETASQTLIDALDAFTAIGVQVTLTRLPTQ